MTGVVLSRMGRVSYGELLAGLPLEGGDAHTSLLNIADPGVRAALQAFDHVALDDFLGLNRVPGLVKAWGATDIGRLAWALDVFTFDMSSGIAMGTEIEPSHFRPVQSQSLGEVYAQVVATTRAHRSITYDMLARPPWIAARASDDETQPQLRGPSRVHIGPSGEPPDRAQFDDDPSRVDISSDAVTVARTLAHVLGVPLKDILKASEISRSSFHSWDKPSRPRPRLSSQGSLWALAELANELTETLKGNVAEWMRAHPTRRALLRAGEFDALYAQAFERPFRRGEGAAPNYALTAGVHDEPEGPLVERDAHAGVSPRPVRRAKVAKVARRSPHGER